VSIIHNVFGKYKPTIVHRCCPSVCERCHAHTTFAIFLWKLLRYTRPLFTFSYSAARSSNTARSQPTNVRHRPTLQDRREVTHIGLCTQSVVNRKYSCNNLVCHSEGPCRAWPPIRNQDNYVSFVHRLYCVVIVYLVR